MAKRVQRWSGQMGDCLVAARSQEVRLGRCGVHPDGLLNSPLLLAIGMDGGCVHTREKNPRTQKWRREGKIAIFTSYRPRDGPPPRVAG